METLTIEITKEELELLRKAVRHFAIDVNHSLEDFIKIDNLDTKLFELK